MKKYYYTEYQNGTLEASLNGLETNEIIKAYRYHGFGIKPSKIREKVITQFMNGMEKAMNKGNAFMR